MQNDRFVNTTSRKTTSGRTNLHDKTLQDQLMQELAEHKASLENLVSEEANEHVSPGTNTVSSSGEQSGILSSSTLRGCVRQALQDYFAQLDGQVVDNIYEMVLSEVEAPLLEVVMSNAMGNQCKAAELLGLSRGTLRKKLQRYDML